MGNKTSSDADSTGIGNGPPPPSAPCAGKRGPVPGAPRLKTREDVRKELARLYVRGKIGDPRKGEPPMKPQTVNALVMLLNSLLADLRWDEQHGAKLRDDEFERQLDEALRALQHYKDILIANGLLRAADPARRCSNAYIQFPAEALEFPTRSPGDLPGLSRGRAGTPDRVRSARGPDPGPAVSLRSRPEEGGPRSLGTVESKGIREAL